MTTDLLVKVRDLKHGDTVDLEGDPYATAPCEVDPDCTINQVWNFEYGVVGELIEETPTCFSVVFENNDHWVGFPPDHLVKVVERV